MARADNVNIIMIQIYFKMQTPELLIQLLLEPILTRPLDGYLLITGYCQMVIA